MKGTLAEDDEGGGESRSVSKLVSERLRTCVLLVVLSGSPSAVEATEHLRIGVHVKTAEAGVRRAGW